MIRVYVALTLPGLADLLESGSLRAPLRAHAVTDAVRREWSDGSATGSEEEWEYEALGLAAEDCRKLWGELGAEAVPRRRVVVAADVADVGPGDLEDPSAVTVGEEVRLAQVAAVHGDLSEADAAAGDDLAWFATQEADLLLA